MRIVVEYTRAIICQREIDVTGRAEVSLKTTPAAGVYDFWGGALRVTRDCTLEMGKAVLQLEDGRTARILVDSIRDDDNGTRLVTFLGYTPLLPPPAAPAETAGLPVQQPHRRRNPGCDDEDDVRGHHRERPRLAAPARLLVAPRQF